MNRILEETHKKQNINYLRVRDYFFDKARKLNMWKNTLIMLPIFILAFSYLPFLSCYAWINDTRDYYVGFFSILGFIAAYIITLEIDKDLKISNAFREEYDVHVFGMRRNDFFYDEQCINNYIEISNNTIKDSKKYEYWYEEIFSTNHVNNVICCQMDNVIYTFHVYKKTKQIYTRIIGMLGVLMVGLWIVVHDVQFMVLSLISLFSVLQMFIEYINVANDLIERNEYLYEKVKKHDRDFTEEDVRNIQDCIIINRENSLFIPKFIRGKYLKDGNPYYEDLETIKKTLMDRKETSMPSASEEIDVVSSDGKSTTNLTVLHDRLRVMLQDIKDVFDRNGIQYTLDGGTLIGAFREGGKFIFWDDDVDIAIRYENFEQAKEVLRNELEDKYEFQDYDEPFYSPRLSNLRMREKNQFSIVEEKDSPLFELYEKRGLFIDIYVYAPILCNRFIDSIYRMLFIHSIHESIKKTEELWKSDRKKYGAVFAKKKTKYRRRVNWYLGHATCTEYYTYTPNYIENLKCPGPYIKVSDLYGENKECMFEDMMCAVPSNSESVLEAFYGKDWNKSPFIPLDELESYGKKTFPVTRLKHISYVDICSHTTNEM